LALWFLLRFLIPTEKGIKKRSLACDFIYIIVNG